jgi:hypothetical protein
VSEIIDYKPYMDSDHKVYVDVNEDRLKDGQLLPRSFVWEDGNCYEVDKILDVRPAASLKAGGTGMRYTVRVMHKETFMYLEEDGDSFKWFMERKTK